MLNRKVVSAILLCSMIWGLASSFKWIYPIFIAPAQVQEAFIPVRYYPNSLSDNYFYYTKVRTFIDQDFLNGDSVTNDYSRLYTPHSSYSLSFFFASLYGQITGNAEHNFYFNNFIWPFLGFLTFSFLVFSIVPSLSLSLLITLYTFCVTPELSRFPNIQVTSVFLTFLWIYLLNVHDLSRTSARNNILFCLLAGTSLLVSVPNFLVTTFSVIPFYFLGMKKKNILNLSLLGLACLLVLTPGMFLLLRSQETSTEWFAQAIPPLDQYRGFKSDWFVADIKNYFLLPFLLFLVPIKFDKKLPLLKIMSFLLVGYTIVSLGHSSFVARYFFSRGADLLFASINLILLVSYSLHVHQLKPIATAVITMRRKLLFQDPARLYLTLITSLVALYVLPIAFKYTRTEIDNSFINSAKMTNKDLKDLYQWINLNSTNEDSVLSSDPDLHIVLNIYTPANLYLPWAQLSPAPTQERLFRFFELASLYGLGKDETIGALKEIIPHYQMTNGLSEIQIRRALLQLIVFYGQFAHTPPTKHEIEKLSLYYDGYQNLNRRVNVEKFKYLVVSKFDLIPPGRNSVLSGLIEKGDAEFSNATYSVFKISKI